MIYQMYSIRDELSGFMAPALDGSDALALRGFSLALDSYGKQPNAMTFRPSDFSLYRIATFDTETGTVTPLVPAVLVSRGSDYDVRRTDHV